MNTGAIRLPAEATSILIQAKSDKADKLAQFLFLGASTVREAEPKTLQWVAQDEGSGSFRIVDFFAGKEGRDAHFAGQVAAALQEQADELVEGGWEKGVVQNIENSQVLSSVIRSPELVAQASFASYIRVRAKVGQAESLAEFLKNGAEDVSETEPGTLLWYALRINELDFAIYDVFASEDARQAHFGGAVAAALLASSERLVEGGWEQGVLSNVVHSKIISLTS